MLKAQDIEFEIDNHGEAVTLLNSINFAVPSGHFMAIVGTSGCGKTTLLKTIAGINEETSGNFFWNGRNLAESDFDPSEIGYVPQFCIAYEELTVDENVEYAARLKVKFENDDDMNDLLDRVLDETGLTNIQDRKAGVLSGGQKRRLSLAMELVSEPELLLCDEVTSGLDPLSEREIVGLLRDLAHKGGRTVISVTHSLAQLSDYDSILVLHQGHVAYHGSPQAMLHYFGVDSPEQVYKKLLTQRGKRWNRSWEKHKESFYAKLQAERQKKLALGEIVLPHPDEGEAIKKGDTQPLPWGSEENKVDPGRPEDEKDDRRDRSSESSHERESVETPSILSQFFTLLGRRWRIFLRNKTQLTLQIVMIILFPIMVSLFSSKGQDPINKLSSQRDINLIIELQQRQAVQENHVKVGSAVSGIIMFEVILLGLMGSNNASREIAGERAIAEKEKYGGMSPVAYIGSKITFLATLVIIQSVWMFIFVDFWWPFRGNSVSHLLFLILANASMTSVCLGISALSKTADQASLLSIYLVGFQLPLSGAVLALPTVFETIVRPFISAYWAWSGSLSALSANVYNAVKVVIDTTLSLSSECYIVLIIHILVGIGLTYYGVNRSQWD